MDPEMYLKTVGYLNNILLAALTRRLLSLENLTKRIFAQIRYAYLQVISLGQKLFSPLLEGPDLVINTERVSKYCALWSLATYFLEHDTLSSAEEVFLNAKKALERSSSTI